jgi:hypothetical protein
MSTSTQKRVSSLVSSRNSPCSTLVCHVPAVLVFTWIDTVRDWSRLLASMSIFGMLPENVTAYAPRR